TWVTGFALRSRGRNAGSPRSTARSRASSRSTPSPACWAPSGSATSWRASRGAGADDRGRHLGQRTSRAAQPVRDGAGGDRSRLLGALGTFGIGLLVGAGVGLLLAPKAGSALRQDLRTKFRRDGKQEVEEVEANGSDGTAGGRATMSPA